MPLSFSFFVSVGVFILCFVCANTKQGTDTDGKGFTGLSCSTQAKVNYKQKATMRRNVEMQLIVREKFFVATAGRESGWELAMGTRTHSGSRKSGSRKSGSELRECNNSGKRHCTVFG